MAHFTCNFISYSLVRSVTFSIVVPSMVCPQWAYTDDYSNLTHVISSPYPVLYLLHGTANDYTSWLRYTNIERLAEQYSIAVVTFSSENKAYLNRNNHDHFYDFLAYELPEFVTANFAVSADPKDTYIAGLSMGGYGTLLHSLSRPGHYRAAGAFSAGIQRFADDTVTDIHNTAVDLYGLARQAAAAGEALPDVYMACGEKDSYFTRNKEFCDLLCSLGFQTHWDQMPQYGHEWGFWNDEIEKFLKWLPREDAYAESGKRTI